MGMGYVVDWDLEYNKDICTIYKVSIWSKEKGWQDCSFTGRLINLTYWNVYFFCLLFLLQKKVIFGG